MIHLQTRIIVLSDLKISMINFLLALKQSLNIVRSKNNKGGMSAKEHASYVIKSLRRCKMIKFPYDPMRQKAINVESLCLQNFRGTSRVLLFFKIVYFNGTKMIFVYFNGTKMILKRTEMPFI